MLEATLESLARQILPTGVGYEVIVVDNNSTDDTAQVAEKFTSRTSPPFRYVVEKIQGLCTTRNRGIAESRGEIVAFLDDDAIADPDWLAQLLAIFDREPDVACVGGKAVLQLPPGPLPPWYSDKIAGYLSARDLPYGLAKSTKDFPYGVNMSFRKSVVLQVGGFYPLFGAQPRGRILQQGDESQLCLRLWNHGHPIFFQPAARVVHVIREGRLRKEYFLSLAKVSGYLDVILENKGRLGVSTRQQLAVYVRKFYRRWREYRRHRSTMSEADQFRAQMMLVNLRNSIWYCLYAKRIFKRTDELAHS